MDSKDVSGSHLHICGCMHFVPILLLKVHQQAACIRLILNIHMKWDQTKNCPKLITCSEADALY